MSCPICCRSVESPYRRYTQDGKVREGCVDECHGPHLIPGTESSRWHHRPAAKTIRKGLAKYKRS